MTTYIDSSVVLRFVLGQPGRLQREADAGVRLTSVLTRIECLRVVDSRMKCGEIAEADYPARRAAVFHQLRRMHQVELSNSVVERACGPLPVAVRTLDALHLATALEWRDEMSDDVRFATHDARLAVAAEALGFAVIGL